MPISQETMKAIKEEKIAKALKKKQKARAKELAAMTPEDRAAAEAFDALKSEEDSSLALTTPATSPLNSPSREGAAVNESSESGGAEAEGLAPEESGGFFSFMPKMPEMTMPQIPGMTFGAAGAEGEGAAAEAVDAAAAKVAEDAVFGGAEATCTRSSAAVERSKARRAAKKAKEEADAAAAAAEDAGAFSSMLSFVPSLPRFSSGENEAEASDDAGGAAKEGSMVSHFLSLAGDIIEEADGGELKRALFFRKVLSRERTSQFAIVMDWQVFEEELSWKERAAHDPTPDNENRRTDLTIGTPIQDTHCGQSVVDRLIRRIQDAQSTDSERPKHSTRISYFVDANVKEKTLHTLDVELEKLFDAHLQTVQVPKHVLVVVGKDPTTLEATLDTFNSKIHGKVPAIILQLLAKKGGLLPGIMPNITFTFLQTRNKAGEGGAFYSSIQTYLEESADIPDSVAQALGPTALGAQSLNDFIQAHFPENQFHVEKQVERVLNDAKQEWL